jgi:hypothetical protein
MDLHPQDAAASARGTAAAPANAVSREVTVVTVGDS